MKRHARNPSNVPMTPDAYAGFLRLLLTHPDRDPTPSADVDAYLRYRSQVDPLPDNVKRILGQPTVEAA